MNPYIQIEFPDEANEYGIDLGTTASDPAYKAAIKDGKPSSTDSHADVTITSFTINGEDKKAEIVRVKAGEYVLALTGLEVGEYEIVYTAHDDVGNEIKADDSGASFTFEVQKRQPYKVELQPGWNLVSVPGDPFNPAVGEVVGASLKADTVLSYQGGEWVTAVRNDEGPLAGHPHRHPGRIRLLGPHHRPRVHLHRHTPHPGRRTTCRACRSSPAGTCSASWTRGSARPAQPRTRTSTSPAWTSGASAYSFNNPAQQLDEAPAGH